MFAPLGGRTDEENRVRRAPEVDSIVSDVHSVREPVGWRPRRAPRRREELGKDPAAHRDGRRDRRGALGLPFVASTVTQPGVARAATTWKSMKDLPAIEPGAHPALTVRELTPRQREFTAWLDGVREECIRRGISEETVGSCFNELEPLPETVVEKTASSHVLNPEKNLSVEAYLRRMVSKDRVTKGAALLVEHAELLNEVEREYGVPPEILVAIWGIESHFGGFQGEHDCIRALATLGFEHRHWKGGLLWQRARRGG